MKKLLFVLLAMFLATILSANHQRLEARPILFLISNISWQTLEGKDLMAVCDSRDLAYNKDRQELLNSCKRDFLSKFGKEMPLGRTAAFSNDAERKFHQECWSKRDKLDAAYQEAIERNREVENESWNKIHKRIAELTEEYAKEMGACAVEPINTPPFYFDPAYDITPRVLEQINKEYLERRSSQPAKQPCVCECHKGQS